MDSGKYREVMTDLFFHGKTPDTEPEPDAKTGKVPTRPASTPKRSKLDELRAFNESIAARRNPTE